jgi:hypothetical protein
MTLLIFNISEVQDVSTAAAEFAPGSGSFSQTVSKEIKDKCYSTGYL